MITKPEILIYHIIQVPGKFSEEMRIWNAPFIVIATVPSLGIEAYLRKLTQQSPAIKRKKLLVTKPLL
jgi:hypothetical protein